MHQDDFWAIQHYDMTAHNTIRIVQQTCYHSE